MSNCIQCGKKAKIKARPSRHLLSPNIATFHLDFCSKECRNQYNKDSTRFWIELDKNASDSQCFQHDHWEGKMRVGSCKITNQKVFVEPMQPGNNSGQPIECYHHFISRK